MKLWKSAVAVTAGRKMQEHARSLVKIGAKKTAARKRAKPIPLSASRFWLASFWSELL